MTSFTDTNEMAEFILRDEETKAFEESPSQFMEMLKYNLQTIIRFIDRFDVFGSLRSQSLTTLVKAVRSFYIAKEEKMAIIRIPDSFTEEDVKISKLYCIVFDAILAKMEMFSVISDDDAASFSEALHNIYCDKPEDDRDFFIDNKSYYSWVALKDDHVGKYFVEIELLDVGNYILQVFLVINFVTIKIFEFNITGDGYEGLLTFANALNDKHYASPMYSSRTYVTDTVDFRIRKMSRSTFSFFCPRGRYQIEMNRPDIVECPFSCFMEINDFNRDDISRMLIEAVIEMKKTDEE